MPPRKCKSFVRERAEKEDFNRIKKDFIALAVYIDVQTALGTYICAREYLYKRRNIFAARLYNIAVISNFPDCRAVGVLL